MQRNMLRERGEDKMEDQGLLAGFFALSFAFILVILIWAVIAYLLTAFALYTMAKMTVQRMAFLHLFLFK